MMEKTCLFCDIIARRKPATIVYEDDHCIVLMDIQPVNPGHMLVIPKTHVEHVEHMDLQEGAHTFQTVIRMTAALRASGIPAEGLWLMLADGQVAGQEVPHAHFHIMPRFPMDGVGVHFGPEFGVQPPHQELERLAARIRAAL